MILGPSWRHITRAKRLYLAIFLLWNIFDITQVQWHLSRAQIQSSDTYNKRSNQKIFLASTHWNNEVILRNHWIPAVLQLAQHIGPDNIFVSVVESGSWDDTKGALLELDWELSRMGIQRSIVLNNITHEDAISSNLQSSSSSLDANDWVMTSRNKLELRRIPYLSHIRNLSLKPLHDLVASGTKFDKILFLNDVVFNINDYETLLNTNNGDYAAACSLDFSKPPHFYDTFALRDSEGHGQLMTKWPYFRSRTSRRQIKAGKAVSVTSCWNGMIIMNATPFQSPHHPPLTFRSIPTTLSSTHHLEASECCLIHTDNPLTPLAGIYLNPNVRVAYNYPAYLQVNNHNYNQNRSVRGVEIGFWKIGWRGWENRIRRWVFKGWWEEWKIDARFEKWLKGDGGEDGGKRREESGRICLVDEMQVITVNGWAHV